MSFDINTLSSVLVELFTLEVMVAIAVGVIGGVIIGALPGLSATMGIALLIPVTAGMSPIAGLAMLVAIYTSAIYGGSISAILIHTPGTPASAATALDGYPMTSQGKGLKALGVSTFCSMIGGLFSAICLFLLAPPLAAISLRFSSPEYFLIAVFGLTIIGALGAESLAKGLIVGALGLFLGTWGVDVLTGFSRFTFGFVALESGISFVPAMIGLFSISQVMLQVEEMFEKSSRVAGELKGSFWPNWSEIKTIWKTMASSSIIGVIIGILPGAGGDIASWVSLDVAKKMSKNPEKFGTGCIEGIAAPETANNAVTGGALIPLLTLGIPGSSAAAVFMGGLLIQGLQPGHELFTEHANITYAVIMGFFIANILMAIVGWLAAKYVVKVADISSAVLAPIIVVLSVVGSFAINNSVFDIYIMVFFGIVGYYLRKANFPTAAIVLGMILGTMAERGFRQSLVLAKGDMFGYIAERPISLIIIALIVLGLGSTVYLNSKKKDPYSESDMAGDV